MTAAETVSTTDPDAAWAIKGGPAMLAYYDNYLIDRYREMAPDTQEIPPENRSGNS